MTLEMGRVETQAQESPRAAAQEAVATAVAQVSAQAQPVESSGVSALDLARDKQRRLFRLLGLGVTMVLAVFAIGFGQWALVNGATSEALFLSGTGLVGLVGAFLSKN